MDVLKEVSLPARRVYRVITNVAESGICKASQRQFVAMLSIAFKTLRPALDELVSAGLIVRIYHYRGRRDWYKVIPVTRLERIREAKQRDDARSARADAAHKEVRAQLSLGIEGY